MDDIQKVLIKAGRKDLAQQYYKKYAAIKVAKGKWIQEVTKSPGFDEGALRKHFGVGEDEKITKNMINKELSALQKKYPDGGYSKEDLKLLRQLNFAKNVYPD
jgi:hypothetical protein